MKRSRLFVLLALPILSLLYLTWDVPAAYAHNGIENGQNPFTDWKWNPLTTQLLMMVAYV